jgi:hypothetical protein
VTAASKSGPGYEEYRKTPWLSDAAPSLEKKNGRTDLLPLTNLSLSKLLPIDRFLQFSSRGELRDSASSNFDGGTSLRVPPVTGLALRNRESAKSDQSYPVSLFEGSGNAVHGGVDRGCGLRLAHVTGSRDTVHEISFVHLFS